MVMAMESETPIFENPLFLMFLKKGYIKSARALAQCFAEASREGDLK
ncbi:hypothetical protein [Candidatus Pyrohabitans sp.]